MSFTKFLDPKTDLIFKQIFGTEKHKDILIHFINDILELKGSSKVENIKFLNPSLNTENPSDKRGVVDVLCVDRQGSRIIVEMQVGKELFFLKRVQFHACKAYSTQLLENGAYRDLKDVFIICIVDFDLFPQKKDYISSYNLYDKKTYERDFQAVYYTFVQLRKFYKTKDQLENIIEKWVYFFQQAEETKEEDLKKIIGNDLIIGKAYDALRQCNWSSEELFAYDRAKQKEGHDLANLLDIEMHSHAEGKKEGKALGIEEGIEKGIEKGKALGREEGIEKGKVLGREEGIEKGKVLGRQEGRQEGIEEGIKQEKIAIAKNLLKAGMSIDKIAEVTNLTINIIQSYK